MDERICCTVKKVWFMLPLIGLLVSFPPISTSMYLPAMPGLQVLWGVSLKTINLTLIFFYLGFCSALLFYGPVSDRFGRRPLLMASIILFIMGSCICAGATSVLHLIYGRICQGIGAAGPAALGLSIIKDYYEESDRKNILAITSIIVALAPMLGPIFGSWVLIFTGWRMIFTLQIIVAVIALGGVIKMPETLGEKEAIPLRQMATPYINLSRNTRFFSLNFLFAISMWPHFAFIAASPEIYISGFNMSAQLFGIYFGLNAMALALGSFCSMGISKKTDDMTMIKLGFSGMLVSGIILYFIPHSHPVVITLPMLFISICLGVLRPFSINMVLKSVDQHTGAASSLIMFAYLTLGSMATWIISMDWPDKISVIGFLSAFASLMILIVLNLLFKKK